MPAADVLGGGTRERLVVAGTELVRRERVGAASEVDRERGQLGPVAPQQAVGRQRGDDARVEAAGQQAAQRHVGDGLAVHDVGQELADLLGRGREVVGVLARLQRPVRRRPQPNRPTWTIVPGRTWDRPR